MGKKAKKAKDQGKRGFRSDSKEGKFLAKLLKSKKLSPGIPPAAVKEMYPVFEDFKNDSFASGLRRMKTKFGLNVRGNTGTSVRCDRSMRSFFDYTRALTLFCLFFFFFF